MTGDWCITRDEGKDLGVEPEDCTETVSQSLGELFSQEGLEVGVRLGGGV